MKVVATVEARMASTRLPGKTMMDVLGRPVLDLVVERLSMARSLDQVVVATTLNPQDDVIAHFCQERAISYHRGSEEDVLGRVLETAQKVEADIIVQMGADNPFYDPELVDELVSIFRTGKYDYACNDMELTYPLGVDAHVLSTDLLRDVNSLAAAAQDREDVTRYIWERPDRYRIFNLRAPKELHRPDLRLTLDYEEDLTLTRKVYEAIYPTNPRFTTLDVIRFLDAHPEVVRLNSHCQQHSAPYIR